MSREYLRKYLIGVTLLAVSLFLMGSAPAQAVDQLSMGTANVGGLFPNLGIPMAECINKALPEVNVTAEYTEGSTENLRLMRQEKMQLAIISPMIGYFARNGAQMFKDKPVDFRVIARLLPNGNIWATLKKNTTIKTIRDIKGHKVGVGTGGIGVVSRMQLEYFGIDVAKDIKPYFVGTGALAEILKDGTVDVSFLTKELAIMVTATHPIRIIPWAEDDLKDYGEKNPYFGSLTYPANTFKGVDYDVLTNDNGVQFICDASMSEEQVYKITKALVENLGCIGKIYAPAKELTPAWCATKLGNPFHAGAIKYYKEVGLWND